MQSSLSFTSPKSKSEKKLMKLIRMEDLHKSIFSLVLDSNNPIPQKTIMNDPIVLQLSQLYAINSFMGVNSYSNMVAIEINVIFRFKNSSSSSGGTDKWYQPGHS